MAAFLVLFPTTAPASPIDLTWTDLEPAAVADGRYAKRQVTLEGFLLPADWEGDFVYSFMLVPRRGACSHMDQPPAHQIVRVVPQEPLRIAKTYEPVRIRGRLAGGLEKTQLFILDGVAVIESGFSMRGAVVEKLALAGPDRPSHPWTFLQNKPEAGAAQQ